jgi:hypothetical protein
MEVFFSNAIRVLLSLCLVMDGQRSSTTEERKNRWMQQRCLQE